MYAIEQAARTRGAENPRGSGRRPTRDAASWRDGRPSRADRGDRSGDSRASGDEAVAAERSARRQARRDRDPIPRLIEQLESDDPATRMMAIGALERLTGETLGYLHYDPLRDRLPAVRRWREAYAAGAFDALPDPEEDRVVDGAAGHD